MQFRAASFLSAVMLSGAVLGAPDNPAATSERDGQAQEIRLIAADELIGRDVVTQEAEHVGKLRFVTVSLDESNISQLIVDTAEGNFGPADRSQSAQADEGGLLVIPWDAADLAARAGAVSVAATGHHIANAPRLQREQLNRLTEPSVGSYVADYWAPVSELAALEGQQQPDQPERLRASDQDRAGEQSVLPGDRSQQQPAPPTQMANAGGPNQLVLVGEEEVATVAPPMFQLSQQLQGSRVTNRHGQALGEIHRIMIDSGTGDVAFAIIDGTPAGRASVPLQVLEWSAKGSIALTVDVAALQPNPAFTENPGRVRRDQLAELYQRFDLAPYWETHRYTATRPTEPESGGLPK